MKHAKIIRILFSFCFVWLLGSREAAAYAAEKPEYLKSVTYFGDEWPINYWNSEDKNMDENFSRIVGDGFNSIILVIPWREFQPLNADEKYNQAAFDRLERVMERAESHGLWVTLRIGYSWDFYGPTGLPERYEAVVYKNSPERAAWLEYSRKLYETVSVHPNFHSGFITWEDFWNFTYNMNGDLTPKVRVKIAAACGYTEYLASRYSIEEVSKVYNRTFRDYSEVYIPYGDTPAAALFYEYYDEFLNDLLKETQAVFPELSMEVRVDGDIIYNPDGSYRYYSHKATYACEGAPYSALMYSVSLGQINKSNRISADTALQAITRNMNNLYSLSGKKFYVEQLLYMDSTAAYSYNTQIEEEQVGEFVERLAPILTETTSGYGLWVYRNYVNNCVYNGQFGLGSEGWNFLTAAQVEERDGTSMARLDRGGTISQALTGRLGEAEKIYVRFYADPDGAQANLKISIGGTEKRVYVTEPGVYSVSIPWQVPYDLEIYAGRRVYLDDIKVYSSEQQGRIYDTDGEELDLAESFRILNGELP